MMKSLYMLLSWIPFNVDFVLYVKKKLIVDFMETVRACLTLGITNPYAIIATLMYSIRLNASVEYVVLRLEIVAVKMTKLDNNSKLLIRLDFILLITIIISSYTYYQIKDWWELDHNTALLYSFMLGLGVGGLSVISIRHYRKRK